MHGMRSKVAAPRGVLSGGQPGGGVLGAAVAAALRGVPISGVPAMARVAASIVAVAKQQPPDIARQITGMNCVGGGECMALCIWTI
eukprot:357613-Chlamydomonas_euryale.AAC.9